MMYLMVINSVLNIGRAPTQTCTCTAVNRLNLNLSDAACSGETPKSHEIQVGAALATRTEFVIRPRSSNKFAVNWVLNGNKYRLNGNKWLSPAPRLESVLHACYEVHVVKFQLVGTFSYCKHKIYIYLFLFTTIYYVNLIPFNAICSCSSLQKDTNSPTHWAHLPTDPHTLRLHPFKPKP